MSSMSCYKASKRQRVRGQVGGGAGRSHGLQITARNRRNPIYVEVPPTVSFALFEAVIVILDVGKHEEIPSVQILTAGAAVRCALDPVD